MAEQSWICCQLGARQHYAVPLALHHANQLAYLLTDAWLPRSVARWLPTSLAKLGERFHPALVDAPIHAFTGALIRFELAQGWQKSDWERIYARDRWFQQQAVQALQRISLSLNSRPILFAFSYAALDILRFAKQQGWRTVLGQIDPGLVEEKIIRREYEKYPDLYPDWRSKPNTYWANWQTECHLAERIVVNSAWSADALHQLGIPEHKVAIIPLAYQPPSAAAGFVRTYPATFSTDRPLRVLFLGQIVLRKGVIALLEAAEVLYDQPVEFWMVGQRIDPVPNYRGRVNWIEGVARSATAQYYRSADIFLLPTLSDGFALTQLEAQAWQLPIIASRFCGEVVKDQHNGLLLPEVTAEAIVRAIRYCLSYPQQLQQFAQNARSVDQFSLTNFQQKLQSLMS